MDASELGSDWVDDNNGSLNSDWVDDNGDNSSFKRNISDVARPILEVGGSVGGGVIGSGLGPVGTFAGGALGYSLGKSGADLVDRFLGVKEPISNIDEAAKETVGNIYEGTKFETGNLVAGPILKKAIDNPVTNFIGRRAVDIGSLASGIKPGEYKKVFENPEAMLPGQLNRAGKMFASAKESVGIPNETSPDALDAIKNSRNRVISTYKKLYAGDQITPAEAQLAKQSLDYIRPTPNGKNGELLHHLDTIRNAFSDVISNASPELQNANKEYSIAKAGQKFKSIFPRTKSGDVSYLKSAAIGATGLKFSHPLIAAASTPVGQGVITAGSGAAKKGIELLANSPELTKPIIQKVKKILDEKMAAKLLEKNNWDPDKAREEAKKQGYSWEGMEQ